MMDSPTVEVPSRPAAPNVREIVDPASAPQFAGTDWAEVYFWLDRLVPRPASGGVSVRVLACPGAPWEIR